MKNRVLVLVLMLTIFLMPLSACSLRGNLRPTTETTTKIEDNRYTISFECNGGSSLAEVKIEEGNGIVLGKTIKDGYDFLGWYLDSSFNEPFTLNTMPGYDLTLYAKWEEKKYTVTFETYSKDTLESLKFSEGEEMILPNPVLKGYKFDGWYLDENLEHRLNQNTMPGKDLTLYAKWVFNVYTIDFVTGFDEIIVDSIMAESGTDITLEDLNKKTYVFLGWYLDQKGTSKFEGTKMPDNNLTLYAKWEREKYDVVLYTLDESLNYLVACDERFNLPEPVKEHYSFEGWFYDEDFEKEIDDKFIVIKDKIELYSKWELVNYTLSFVTNYNDCSIAPLKHTFLESPNLPTLDSKYYSLEGYYLDEEFTEPVESGYVIPNENAVLYAKLEPIYHKVSFGIDEIDDIYARYGELITLPNGIDTELQYFTGWYLDNNGPYTKYLVLEDDIKFTPHYKDITYTITFHSDINDYDDSKLTITYKKNEAITEEMLKDKDIYPLLASLYDFEKGYFSIVGWNLDSSSDSERFHVTENKDYELYANWQDTKIHSVELIYFVESEEKYSNELSGYDNYIIEGHEGEQIDFGSHNNPICEYMDFLGYYEAEIVDGRVVYGDKISGKIDKKVSYIAEMWEPKTYKFSVEYTFEYVRHVDVYYFKYKEAISSDVYVSTDEYEINRLYYDKYCNFMLSRSTTMPHNDLYVYATVTDLRITVYLLDIFDEDFNSIYWIERKTLSGNKITLPEPISSDDWTFVGWKLNDGSNLYSAGTEYVVTEETYFRAIYEHKKITISFVTDYPFDAISESEYSGLTRYYDVQVEYKKEGITFSELASSDDYSRMVRDLDTLANYTVTGFYYSNEFVKKVTNESRFTGNITLYALWENCDFASVTVYQQYNGGYVPYRYFAKYGNLFDIPSGGKRLYDMNNMSGPFTPRDARDFVQLPLISSSAVSGKEFYLY